MKIDGYIPTDEKVALEEGVPFDLPTEWGTITIRSRILNDLNPAYMEAVKRHLDWEAPRRKALGSVRDEEADRRFLGVIYDQGVISWSTTIKSDGKPIKPTRENFIELMLLRELRVAREMYFEQARNDRNFRAASREDDTKN